MYCRKCGAQIPDDSSFCPKCGTPTTVEKPLTQIENQCDELNEPVKLRSIAPLVVVIAVLVAAIVPIAFLYSRQNQGLNITEDSVTITQLYNPALGVGVKLGMDKATLDRLLGTPQSVNGDYKYEDTRLYVGYTGGKLSHMYITFPNDRWITYGGISIDTTTDDLLALLGEPASIEHDDKWWYYASGSFVTGFEISRDSVESIYIYDANLVEAESE